MKILMVLESAFPPDTRVENEIQQILELGYDITIASLNFSNKPHHEVINGLQVIRKDISKIVYKTSVGSLKFPFYFNFWKKYLRELIESNDYDVLHIHDLPLVEVGLQMRKEFGIKVLMDLHENWPALIADAAHTNTFMGKLLSSKKQWREYEKKSLLKVDSIITVVEEMKNRILLHGIDKDKVFVVPNVLNISTFPNGKVDIEEGISLFYGGGLTHHRGLQVVIKGMSLLNSKYKNIKLIIVGYGSYRGELENLVKDLDLTTSVEFLGRMTQKNLLIEMKKCTIALIPHLKSIQTDNSSPNKLFQYMYAEKPVLSSDCDSLRRVIEGSNVGVLYSDKDPKDFSEKLEFLLQNNKNNIFGTNGKKAVLEKYNWSENKNVLKEAYDKAIL